MFSERVLERVNQIPKGRVSTYAGIARALGKPKASRAVGNALNKNPYLIDVPCHRVVRSDGHICGYAGGVKKKIAILESEGIQIKRGRIVDFDNVHFKFKKR